MLAAYWEAYRPTPAALSAIGDDNGIEANVFAVALERLGAGEPAEVVLDDSFVSAYAVAGTVEQCLEQCRDLAATGISQMTLTFHGETPEASMAQFGDAARDA